MGFLQSLVERAKRLSKKKKPAVAEEKPRASIVLPTVGTGAKASKVGDYMERGVGDAAVLTARVKAVARNDLDMLQTSVELNLDKSWSTILDEKA